MRSAPFAFWPQLARAQLRDFCRLTHHHEEAYVGALALVLAIRAVLSGQWTGAESLLVFLVPQLPDTRVRDRLSGHPRVARPAYHCRRGALGHEWLRH